MTDDNSYEYNLWEDCSLSEIKTVLDDVIAEKFMTKKKRRQIVNWIIDSSAYPAEKFSEYDNWNSAFDKKLDSNSLKDITMTDDNLDKYTVSEDSSVSEVKTILDTIIADTSKSKKQRRQAVSRIISSQPHATKKFSDYNKWNSAFNWQPDSISYAFSEFGIGLFAFLFLTFVYPVGIIGGTFLVALPFVGGFLMLFDCKIPKRGNDHQLVYGDRADMSIQEVLSQQEKEAESKRIQKANEEKKQLEYLTKKHSSENATVSLVEAKQDYKDAFARIISYEMDFDKALAYPAFNDMTVKETSAMIRQMKKCERLKDSVTEATAFAFKDEVDELWVTILAAERRAKKISHSGVNNEERKGLEQAQKLLVQIRDDANTEAMKATLYEQLRRVVNRINTKDDVVPVTMVKEIEATTARSIEAGTMNKDRHLVRSNSAVESTI